MPVMLVKVIVFISSNPFVYRLIKYDLIESLLLRIERRKYIFFKVQYLKDVLPAFQHYLLSIFVTLEIVGL